MIVQAELDKRESQWAQAVDTLKLRSCEEQVLLFAFFGSFSLTPFNQDAVLY